MIFLIVTQICSLCLLRPDTFSFAVCKLQNSYRIVVPSTFWLSFFLQHLAYKSAQSLFMGELGLGTCKDALEKAGTEQPWAENSVWPQWRAASRCPEGGESQEVHPAALCCSFAGRGSNRRVGRAANVLHRWFSCGAAFLTVSGTGEALDRGAANAEFFDSSLENSQVI